MTQALPYNRYLKVVVIGLVGSTIKWIDAFPPSNGVSKTLIPAMIV